MKLVLDIMQKSSSHYWKLLCKSTIVKVGMELNLGKSL